MTTDELFAAYPNVQNAVGYVELVFCDYDGLAPGEPSPWEMIRQRKPDAEPNWLADIIRKSCEGSSAGDGPNDAAFIANARREMDHPQFVTYLAGKMGAV